MVARERKTDLLRLSWIIIIDLTVKCGVLWILPEISYIAHPLFILELVNRIRLAETILQIDL